jgi:glycosyltransferase involved in cell wall biosynthesis
MGALSLPDAQLLVESIKLARKEIPDLRFLAIGLALAGTKQPVRSALNLQDEDWMIETGRIPFDQVCTHLNACDVLALPLHRTISNTARWPSKINDYFASGRPVVATSVGEIGRFTKEAHLTADDVESFSNGLVTVFRDPEYARQIGAAGRSLAEGELNWANIVAGLERFYKVVLD